MFFDLARKNSRRSRRENGIFFAALLVSIIASYVVLSLEQQGVMIFLKKMESDAVDRLLSLIVLLYGVSLFIIFFLIYYASKYQLERRSHEMGMYQMLGMPRAKLFTMLIVEDLWSSILALLIGLPIAVALSEFISLGTVRLVGLGIIGHQFAFSWKAVIWTTIGFISVKFVAFLKLSIRISRKEISGLLSEQQEGRQKEVKKRKTIVSIYSGIVFLCIAYGLAAAGSAWKHIALMGITMAMGISGTFLFFDGISMWFEKKIKRKKGNQKLQIFTFRQLQENVLMQSKSTAVSALLILAALCCLGYGISVAFGNRNLEVHVMDVTFHEPIETVEKVLERPEFVGKVQDLFEVKIGVLWTTELEMEDEDTYDFEKEQLMDAVGKLEASQEKDTLLNNLQYFTTPYLISLSGYNEILELQGKNTLQMKEKQMVLYTAFRNEKINLQLEEALKENPEIFIDKEGYELIDVLCTSNLVVDRAIRIGYGLIVPDEIFEKLIKKEKVETYCNMVLEPNFVKEMGLMQAMDQINDKLYGTGLEYETFLQNMGRQLMYVVAASYTTIYLAIMFLIIANTIMSVQFLMRQKKTGRRYQTLLSLGAQYEDLKKSSHTQIKWYFGLPIAFAVLSSGFGIFSLVGGWFPESGNQAAFFGTAVAGVLGLCVIEFIYIKVVMKTNDQYILSLMKSK